MLIYANSWVFEKISKIKHFDQLIPQLLVTFWSSKSLMCALKWQKRRFLKCFQQPHWKTFFCPFKAHQTLWWSKCHEKLRNQLVEEFYFWNFVKNSWICLNKQKYALFLRGPFLIQSMKTIRVKILHPCIFLKDLLLAKNIPFFGMTK